MLAALAVASGAPRRRAASRQRGAATETEPSPLHSGPGLVDQGGHVGGVGRGVRLAAQQAGELLRQGGVEVPLAAGVGERFGLEHGVHLWALGILVQTGRRSPAAGPYSMRTSTLSAAPLASITERRPEPGPPGRRGAPRRGPHRPAPPAPPPPRPPGAPPPRGPRPPGRSIGHPGEGRRAAGGLE